MRPWRWIAPIVVLVACGGAPRPTYTATFTDRTIRIDSYVKAFRAAEPSMILRLEGETRLFARIHPRPASADDGFAPAWIARPFVDPFSFTEREAALTESREELERLSIPPALEADLVSAHEPPPQELRALRFEQEALRRLVEAESDRVERERALPGRAADLLRAIRLAWPMAARPGTLHDVESTVTWRFENLRKALATGSLSEAERDDATSALADLASLLAPLPHAAAEAARLRTALDSLWTAPYAIDDEATMDKELEIYVGAPVSFDGLDGAFVSAARTFDLAVDAGLSVLGEAAQERVRARARGLLFSAPPCAARVPVRTALDLAPPDERELSCALLHATTDARTDEEELAVDLAWRDAIAVARWAVSTHGPVRSKEAALRLATLRAGESSAEAAALFRLAVARPLHAIAAGVAASILTREGGAKIRGRAQKWRALGDAPMDLVAPILGEKR